MGPFKCPDCGIWWAGFEHRCREVIPSPTTSVPSYPRITTGTYNVRCTCPPDRGDNYTGTCQIHDVHTTYTVATS